MLKTWLIAGCLTLPLALTAQADPAPKPPSPGHQMEARILGLDPELFSRTELAQISAEDLLGDRRGRVRFILEMKERRGELPRGFARSPDGQRIIRSVSPW